MPPVPLLKPAEVVQAFARLGWQVCTPTRQPHHSHETRAYRNALNSWPCRRRPGDAPCAHRPSGRHNRRIPGQSAL